jgi:integrase
MGEIIALAWCDIDLENATLCVRESKTEAGKRMLWLPPRLVTALRAHWAFQQQERLVQGLNWKEHGLVFPSERGTPLSGRNLVRHFKRALERAGLSTRIRFHNLRHSCASFLLVQNVHPRVVALTGSTPDSETLDTYSHVLPDTQRDALSKLDNLCDGKDDDKDDEGDNEAIEESG